MKQHPRPVLLACERVGVEPAKAMLIGDSDFDMVAAASDEALPIAFVDEPQKARTLADAVANALVGSMTQLAAAIADVG